MAKKKRTSYAPTRVIAHRSTFHFSHYDDELGYTVKKSTGVELDIDPPKDKEGKPAYDKKPMWWKRSSHEAELSELYSAFENRRRAKYFGLSLPVEPEIMPQDLPSFEQMMDAFNVANAESRDEALSDRVIEARMHAVRFIRLFHPDKPWHELKREDFIRIRDEAKKGVRINGKVQKYLPRSIDTYFGHIRAMYAYALERGYVKVNPIKDVFVKVTKNLVTHIDRADLETLLIFCYHHRPGLFLHINGQHLLLFRVSDGCKTILREHVDKKRQIFLYWNSKARRLEELPYGKAQERHFELALELNPPARDAAGKIDPHLYPYRHRRTVSRYLLHAYIYTNTPPFGTHALKRFGSREFAKTKPDPRTFDLACHHAPTVNQLAVESYSGDDLEALHELYVKAQDPHWVPFLDQLPHTSWTAPEGKRYRWTCKTLEEFRALAKEWNWAYSNVLEDEENPVLDGDESDEDD